MDALATTAPSPFLPGTHIQYALDSTSIGYFKTCPRLYYYVMIEGWQSKEESVHLKFGQLYHEALHLYDIIRLDGLSHEEGVFQVVRWLCDNAKGYPDVSEAKASIRAKSFEGLLRTVIWYLDKYPRETDPAETVTLDNGKPACELSFRFEVDWSPKGLSHMWEWDKTNEVWTCLRCRDSMTEDERDPDNLGFCSAQPYVLCGHLDRVVTFNGDLFVSDRKTTHSGPTDLYWNQWNPNNQMSLYSIAAQIVLGTPVKGIMLDVAQVMEDGPRRGPAYSEFFRGFTYRTKDQNEEWLQDLRHWTQAMEYCATSGNWPMNDTACNNYGGCKFREVCSKSPSVRPNFLKSQFVKGEPWNPLVPRG